jgi:alkanesulfonate monooxygenase SsuD/methylene tetrahydromethanopterin reductase-like flavin-dependent oxidoreductase (luciferase family)
MLARAVADVDRLSGGRAILALGSGDVPWEFDMLASRTEPRDPGVTGLNRFYR